jgi:hypothetical protein
MKPEPMVIQMTDGTEFAALVHMESGKVHVSAVGFLGFIFVLEPNSLRQVCNRLLEIMNNEKDRQAGISQ